MIDIDFICDIAEHFTLNFNTITKDALKMQPGTVCAFNDNYRNHLPSLYCIVKLGHLITVFHLAEFTFETLIAVYPILN